MYVRSRGIHIVALSRIAGTPQYSEGALSEVPHQVVFST